MSTILNCKINLTKVPKERLFKGQKGVYLDFTIAERKEPDQYGQTHNIYLYKKGEDKIYIGNAQIFDFDNPQGLKDDRDELNADRSGMETSNALDDLPF